MSDPTLALQTAIFDRLDGHLGDVTVHDIVPEGTLCPYITIGEISAVDDSSKTNAGMEFSVNIHIWTEGESKKQAIDIRAAVYERLHDAPLSIAGHAVVMCRFDGFTTILRDPAPQTWHGVARYKIMTSKT